jgi:hypothetical protein
VCVCVCVCVDACLREEHDWSLVFSLLAYDMLPFVLNSASVTEPNTRQLIYLYKLNCILAFLMPQGCQSC